MVVKTALSMMKIKMTILCLRCVPKKGTIMLLWTTTGFQDWVYNRSIPTWKRRYPELPCSLVLNNAPHHMGRIKNLFVMTKPGCTNYLHGAGLNKD